MSTSSPAAVPERGGLAVALAVLTAPKQAFSSLAVVPTWGWAFLIAVVLTAGGSLLSQAATLHYMAVAIPQKLMESPAIQKLPADQQQSMLAMQLGIATTIAKFGWVAAPITILFFSLLQSVGFLIVAKIAKSPVGFKRFWAVAINIAIVSSGLLSVATGLILTLRGPDSIASAADLYRAVPSLAWAAPEAPVKLAAFLSGFSVFSIWGTVLAAFGLMYTGQVPKTIAISGAVVLLLLGAAFGAGFAQ
jgi:hypothetical protein